MMPVLFIGHGSPMNALGDSAFVQQWRQVGARLPRPKAIVSISAHWYTQGNYVTAQSNPPQMYDFYGFPPALYQLKYPALGAPELAQQMTELFPTVASVSNYGIDHGSWCPLLFLYPKADIPLLQLSVNRLLTLDEVLEFGQQLTALRQQGVLLLASGNVVHNLQHVDFDRTDGYPWAYDFDRYIRDSVLQRQSRQLVDYTHAGDSATRAFVTLEHYVPLLYAYGATTDKDQVQVFAEGCEVGSVSMTSYLWTQT